MCFDVKAFIKGSYNLNFLLEDAKGEKWVAKVCRSLHKFNLDFQHLDDRSILASRLAKIAEVKVPEYHYIKEEDIKESARKQELLSEIKSNSYLYNPEKIIVSKYIGIPLPHYIAMNGLEKILNLKELLNCLVFDLWIGNYDKKDKDYVLTNKGLAYSIDYNLFGPAFRDSNEDSIGKYTKRFSINEPGDTSFATGNILRNIIIENNYGIDYFDEKIAHIENISVVEISSAFTGLNCEREHTHENINDLFIKFLCNRQKLLRNAINSWTKENYPASEK